jgi:branched-subunit amino acid aminotransferase/4-amino-4-deoxychorismate lyase
MDRHVARMRDGARALRFGDLDHETIRRALNELAAKALPEGEGVIRLQVSADREGGIHLTGVARTLGEDKALWSAIIASQPHDGASVLQGRKITSRLALALAMDEAKQAGVAEALLLDSESNLVEGARTNILVVGPDESLSTPPLESGAVAGIARSIVIEQIAKIEQRTISKNELFSATEIIAINAVRGARPITQLGGQTVGNGSPGAWSLRVAAILAAH